MFHCDQIKKKISICRKFSLELKSSVFLSLFTDFKGSFPFLSNNFFFLLVTVTNIARNQNLCLLTKECHHFSPILSHIHKNNTLPYHFSVYQRLVPLPPSHLLSWSPYICRLVLYVTIISHFAALLCSKDPYYPCIGKSLTKQPFKVQTLDHSFENELVRKNDPLAGAIRRTLDQMCGE